MVKIHIEDRFQFQDKYLLKVKEDLANKLKWLLIAILHLEGGTIVLTSPEQTRVKYYTRHLTKVVDGKPFREEKDYDAADYVNSVADFRRGSIKLLTVDFTNLKNLIMALLAQNGAWLTLLLVCPSRDLITAERFLTRRFRLNDLFDKQVMKLIFFKKSNPFWDTVKDFYRENLPLVACPYCNMVVIKPILATRKYAKTASLDHFFDESRHPILAFCLYNLVPSDTDCNSTNKHTTEFKNNYHLNPYEEGFGKDVRFKARIDPPNTVQDIDLVLEHSISPEKAKRVLGDVQSYDDTHKHGNINVFKLKTLYADEYYKKKAAEAIDDVKNMNTAKASLTKFFQLLPPNLNRSERAYIKWYEQKLKTPFFEKEFQNEILSKLNRDLHDEYYAKLSHPLNFYIQRLINAE